MTTNTQLHTQLTDPETAAKLAAILSATKAAKDSAGDNGSSGQSGDRGNDDGQNDDGDGEDDGESSPGAGFPADTKVKDMTAEQQAAYWKDKARKHEQRANSRADRDQIKQHEEQLIKQIADLIGARPPDQSKQQDEQSRIDTAVQAALAKQAQENALKIAQVQVESALRPVITDDAARAAFVGSLDHSKFLSDTGDVAADKVAALVGTFGELPPQSPAPGDHGGYRTNNGPTGVDAGAQMYADRHHKND